MTDPIARGLLPEGFRDRLPPQAEAADRLVRTLSDTIGAHGYERIQPPLAEFEESLAGRLASETPQDLLRLIDPLSQHTIALRSDITAQAGRIAVTRLAHKSRPLRLSYAGSVLRVRPPQVGAEREAIQLGAELIGSDSEQAVAEVLSLALEALETIGCESLSVDLCLPSLVDELARNMDAPGNMEQVRSALDGKDVAALEEAGGTVFLPLLRATGPAETAVPALRSAGLGADFENRIDAAERLAALAAGFGNVTLDPVERRGFAFQSWCGFSLFVRGVRGEVGRGGTYHVRQEEGSEEAAVGFSLYVDPLAEAGLGTAAQRRIFIPVGTDSDVPARLRTEGWTTVAALSGNEDPAALGCTHIWDGAVRSVD